MFPTSKFWCFESRWVLEIEDCFLVLYIYNLWLISFSGQDQNFVLKASKIIWSIFFCFFSYYPYEWIIPWMLCGLFLVFPKPVTPTWLILLLRSWILYWVKVGNEQRVGCVLFENIVEEGLSGGDMPVRGSPCARVRVCPERIVWTSAGHMHKPMFGSKPLVISWGLRLHSVGDPSTLLPSLVEPRQMNLA